MLGHGADRSASNRPHEVGHGAVLSRSSSTADCAASRADAPRPGWQWHHVIAGPFALFGFDPRLIMALTGFIKFSRRGWSRRQDLR